jgi:hypothetical protein
MVSRCVAIFLSACTLLMAIPCTAAGPRGEGEAVTWHSPNIQPAASDNSVLRNIGGPPTEGRVALGLLAYNRLFEATGVPPAWKFLRPLQVAPAALATIAGGNVLFPRSGMRAALRRSELPPEAEQAPPYLLSDSSADWVLVVYPYYLFGGKETRYVVDLYSDHGTWRSRFDTIPTHVLVSNPSLLISPERAGCCESLRWSFRFYEVHWGTTSEYTCPEARCGDVVFAKLGPEGPLVLALEVLGESPTRKPVAETRLFVISDEGVLLASGAFAYATREAGGSDLGMGQTCAVPERVAARSPFAVANLLSVMPAPGAQKWLVWFRGDGGSKGWEVRSTWERNPAASVFEFPVKATHGGARN